MTTNGIDELRGVDPARDIPDGPLDARALSDLHRVTAPGTGQSGRAARPGRRRLVLAAAGTAVLVAGGTVAGIGGTGSPAYAIERAGDGTVTITIKRIEDADRLERAIERYGVDAEVDYLPWGKVCREPRFTGSGRRAADSPVTSFMTDDGQVVRLRPAEFAAGETLMIVSSAQSPGHVRAGWIQIGVVKGPVSACDPVDRPGSR